MSSEAIRSFLPRWLTPLVAAFLLIFLTGCSKRAVGEGEKLAIPGFENLSGDASLDWIGDAAAAVVEEDLAGSPTVHAILVNSRREGMLAGATRVLYGYFSVVHGRLRVSVSLERTDTHRMAQTFTVEAAATGGLLPLLNTIALRLEPKASPFGTKSEKALKAYVEARAARETAAAMKLYQEAVAADPDFGLAYLSWAQFLAGHGDGAGATQVLAAAGARESRFSELDRTRLDLYSATVHNDAGARMTALRKLANLMPADVDVLRGLAAGASAAHDFETAADWRRKAAEKDPGNALLWNDLGYAEAFAHNLEGAQKALLEYQRLAPGDANALDSLGDVHYFLGKFGEAEKYYLEAYQKNPSFLGGATVYKAARAHLMTGDVPGADRILKTFLEVRRMEKDPLLDYREAQWQYIAGRHGEAEAQLEQFIAGNPPVPDAVSQSYSQLSAWGLVEGKPERARRLADLAAAAAHSENSRQLAAICRFLAEAPAEAGEITTEAARAFPQGNEREVASGYALLLRKQFAASVPVLEKLYRGSSPLSPDQFSVLLAWSLVETGRFPEAARLLEDYGVPQPGGEPLFAFLSFPKVLSLKSAVLEKQGRGGEAREFAEAFRKLSGPQ